MKSFILILLSLATLANARQIQPKRIQPKQIQPKQIQPKQIQPKQIELRQKDSRFIEVDCNGVVPAAELEASSKSSPLYIYVWDQKKCNLKINAPKGVDIEYNWYMFNVSCSSILALKPRGSGWQSFCNDDTVQDDTDVISYSGNKNFWNVRLKYRQKKQYDNFFIFDFWNAANGDSSTTGGSTTGNPSTEEPTTTTPGDTTTTTAGDTTTTTTGGCDCGSSTAADLDKIVGGEDAGVGELPWQAALVYGSQGTSVFCGGTIVADNYVITAAHCTDGQTAGSFPIRVGMHTRSSTNENSKLCTVEEIFQHSEYNSNTLENDISVLKIEDGCMDFSNPNIGKACLASDVNELYVGTDLTVSGWGTLSSGGSQPDILQKVVVPGISNAACSADYSQYGGVTDDMLCAGIPQGGIDSCQGDSGGPLVAFENGKATLAGVVSWGIGCASPGNPGVYSRVTANLQFIKDSMNSGNVCAPK